jgi:hypothetical protein
MRRPADVAELVDAHGSGPCARKGVEVQVLSSALPFQAKRFARDKELVVPAHFKWELAPPLEVEPLWRLSLERGTTEVSHRPPIGLAHGLGDAVRIG